MKIVQKWLGQMMLGLGLVLSTALTGALPSPSPIADTSGAPYIVQGSSSTAVANLVEAAGGTVTTELEIIQGVSALLSPETLARLQTEPDIAQIFPDSQVKISAPQAVAAAQTNTTGTADYGEVTGANLVHADTNGVTGNGVTIAVVDTGLQENLPGIAKDTANQNRISGWYDALNPSNNNPIDLNGHGTHVAGIAISSLTDATGNYDGIAPDANLVGVRVLDETGVGTYTSVIAGLDWVRANKDAESIDIVNLSLVATAQSPYWADPLNQAVMRLWQEGLVVVAAAGNTGPQSMTITVPGNVPYVVTVGAFTDNFTWDNAPNDWDDDYIPPFSAMGPTLDGFVKPDLVAPGAHMVSTMQSNSKIAMNREAYKIGGQKFSMAGTSQATAVVSGIAALMLSRDDQLTPDQVKFRLMRTALLWTNDDQLTTPYSIWEQGAGRVNAYDAVFYEDRVTDASGAANVELDVDYDVNNSNGGYEGYTYFDETDGLYKLRNVPDAWPDSYRTWDGGFSAWSGGFSAWSGGFSAWSGGFSAWSGGFSAWSGGFSAWSGGFSAWSGGFSAWSGGFSAWSGGFSAWSGSEPWAGRFDDPLFVASYEAGDQPPEESPATRDEWEEEMDWESLAIYLPMVVR